MSRLPDHLLAGALSPGSRVRVRVGAGRWMPGDIVAASRREGHWIVRLLDGREETYPAGSLQLSGFQPVQR